MGASGAFAPSLTCRIHSIAHMEVVLSLFRKYSWTISPGSIESSSSYSFKVMVFQRTAKWGNLPVLRNHLVITFERIVRFGKSFLLCTYISSPT